ncbi:hypothetical protein DFH09DRAFT_1367983 [Mycena vulgaris]|nr:hypothetical protein DFH09DRAFT_1367983 [Mycena vulgaris]
MATASDDRLRVMENNTTSLTATLGEVQRALHALLARDHVAPAAPPAVTTIPALAALASVPQQAVVPAAPVPAPALTAPIVPAPAAHETDTRMADMQAMLTAALSAAIGTKRGREDDNEGRNVRHHSDAAGPSTGVAGPAYASPAFTAPAYTAPAYAAPAASTSVVAAPAPVTVAVTHAPPEAPDAPTRRPNNPAHECIFGPVIWKSNINAEARAVIAEGMSSRPNMRHFYTRRGPDSQYIILGFESAGAIGWFIDSWMAQRSGRWASVLARPNA